MKPPGQPGGFLFGRERGAEPANLPLVGLRSGPRSGRKPIAWLSERRKPRQGRGGREGSRRRRIKVPRPTNVGRGGSAKPRRRGERPTKAPLRPLRDHLSPPLAGRGTQALLRRRDSAPLCPAGHLPPRGEISRHRCRHSNPAKLSSSSATSAPPSLNGANEARCNRATGPCVSIAVRWRTVA